MCIRDSRCSRGVQQHRRLCIEPITINPDGMIGEVKMTSQGVGKPFAPGETLFGYQACGLKGTVYIGLDETFGEKLMNISSGDEVIFRYVQNDTDWSEITMTCAGSGKLQIMLYGIVVGNIEITGESGKNQTVSAKILAPAGETELMLKAEASDGLEIMEIVLK